MDGTRTMKTLLVSAAVCSAGAAGLKSLATINPALNDVFRDVCLLGSSGLLAYLGIKLPLPLSTAGPAKGEKP